MHWRLWGCSRALSNQARSWCFVLGSEMSRTLICRLFLCCCDKRERLSSDTDVSLQPEKVFLKAKSSGKMNPICVRSCCCDNITVIGPLISLQFVDGVHFCQDKADPDRRRPGQFRHIKQSSLQLTSNSTPKKQANFVSVKAAPRW